MYPILFQVDVIVARGCISTAAASSPVRSGSYLTLRRGLQHQAIIPSYALNCNATCGNITDWEIPATYFDPDKRRRRRRETLDVEVELSRGARSDDQSAPPRPILGIQVWRPVPPIIDVSMGTGCYSLVGSQGVSMISVPDSDEPLTIRPFLQPDIPFQPGDVLGFYVDVPDSDEIDYVGTEIHQSSTRNEIPVWYAESVDDPTLIASTVPTDYFIGNSPPGTLATSRFDAPAISIAISKWLCS